MVLVQRDSGGDIAEKSFCTERNHKLSQYDVIIHLIVSWRGSIGATRRAIIYRNERRAADEPGDLWKRSKSITNFGSPPNILRIYRKREQVGSTSRCSLPSQINVSIENNLRISACIANDQNGNLCICGRRSWLVCLQDSTHWRRSRRIFSLTSGESLGWPMVMSSCLNWATRLFSSPIIWKTTRIANESKMAMKFQTTLQLLAYIRLINQHMCKCGGPLWIFCPIGSFPSPKRANEAGRRPASSLVRLTALRNEPLGVFNRTLQFLLPFFPISNFPSLISL